MRHRLIPVILLSAAASADATQPVVELQIGGREVTGLVAGHDDRLFHLFRDDGRLETYAVSQVESYKASGTRFRPLNTAKLRLELLREFGKRYEVVTSSRYVVAAPKGRGRDYLQTFDGIARTFTAYFSKRGVPLRQSRFPLVAVIFGTQSEFAEYAREDGVRSTENVAGYYLRTSNRVAAFESSRRVSRTSDPGLEIPRLSGLPRTAPSDVFNVRAAVVGGDGLRETLIHEATHQMAFNTGLHSRLGNDPKWVIEGLATLFEPDAVRKNLSLSSPEDRINQQRLAWFETYLRPKWGGDTLSGLIASDRMFDSDPGGAYSLAWALSFYMNEARPGDYSQYLARLKARDHSTAYSPEDRLKDFQLVFGRDLRRFEVAFLRFMGGLPAARR